jgi:hypothetical protein
MIYAIKSTKAWCRCWWRRRLIRQPVDAGQEAGEHLPGASTYGLPAAG